MTTDTDSGNGSSNVSPLETLPDEPYYNMNTNVKMPTPSGARTYEPKRLSLAQAKMIAALIGHASPTAAAIEAGITVATHKKWLQVDPNYRSAVRELGEELLDSARASLDMLLPAAAEAYAEGVGATAPVDITCPDCGHQFSIRLADLKTRLATADRLFKRSGDMANQVKVSGEIQHRDMALEDRLALAQVSAWLAPGGGKDSGETCPVPPDVFRSLQLRGLLTGEGMLPESPPPVDPGRIGLAPGQLADFARNQDSDIPPGEYRVIRESESP